LIVEDEDSWKLRFKVWNFLQNNAMFHEREGQQPIDEKRRIATKKAVTIFHQNFFGPQDYFERPDLYSKFTSSLIAYDPSVSVKLSLGFGMFPNTLRSLGTDSIMDIVAENQEIKNLGCFALTEISHGSNARGVRTTATYDKESKSFILNSPDFEAAKCWVGNLGNIKL
jgi:acyl-CoA oxidase